METQKSSPEKGKTGQKIIIALIALLVFVALVLAANFLVSNFDLVELLKRIHGS